MAGTNIPYQVAAGSFVYTEQNQILDALQSGTRSILTSGLEVQNGTQLNGSLNVSGLTTFISGAQFKQVAYYDAVVANGAVSTNGSVIDWRQGNKQSVIVDQATTFVFTAPPGPTSVTLLITNVGSYSKTFPSAVEFPSSGTAPSWGTGSPSRDLFMGFYDGTTYWAGANTNYWV